MRDIAAEPFRGEFATGDRKGVTAMDEVIRRYEGRTTSQGHQLDVRRKGDEVTIAFNTWVHTATTTTHTCRSPHPGERGRLSRSAYSIWMPRSQPQRANITNVRDLFVALDEAIEKRSQELGPIGV